MMRFCFTLMMLFTFSALVSAQPPTVIEPRDFVEYWSAARVHAAGRNAYDGDLLLPLQREMSGEPERVEAVMLWTPPWTLPLYTPFGMLAPHEAHLAWLAVQITLTLVAILLLMRVYGAGQSLHIHLAVFGYLILTTCEFHWNIAFGQNMGILTFGLAGFLYCRVRSYPFAAGLLGALTAVKPHLLLPFAMLLLMDVRSVAGRRVLYGGACMIALGSVLAVVSNTQVFQDYLNGLQGQTSKAQVSVKDWQLPLFSYRFRMAVDESVFRWQFLPVALLCLGYAGYRDTLNKPWDWREQLPVVVLLSLLAAPYGGWIFDLTLLLVPIVAGLYRVIRTDRAMFIVLGFAALVPRYLFELRIESLEEGWFITPWVLVWYVVTLWLAHLAQPHGPTAGEVAALPAPSKPA
jgi:hypothetical protein